MMQVGLLAPIAGLCGLIFALKTYLDVRKQPDGTEHMRQIGEQIHLGAMTFLKAEYSKLVIFVVIVAALLSFGLKAHGLQTAAAFITGAICSALAGFFGMSAATKGNVRTAAAAKDHGEAAALHVAFNGGAVMGVSVASLGLLGLGIFYYFFGQHIETTSVVSGFSMGASSIALF